MRVSRWETTSTHEAEVAPAAVWEGAYRDADAWPRWNAELKSARLDGPLAALWRRVLGPAAARTLPDAQRAVVELAR
jgi:hypothetical protein